MFSDILQVQDYHAQNPYVRDVIDEQIRKELNTLGQNDLEFGKSKKSKTSQEQTLSNLKAAGDTRFKYLWAEDNAVDFDYQEEEKKKQNKEMQLVEPPRFEVLGHREDPASKLKRPILRMSDLYLTNNPKVRRLINRVFDKHIYGKSQAQKAQAGVLISKSTSNVQQLEQILKNYQNRDEEYNFENQEANMNEQQLEDYIIDRGQSKSKYFLFYKNQQPAKNDYQVVNNPLNSQNFLKKLHTEVRLKERQYYSLQDVESDQEEQQEQDVRNKEPKKQGEDKKVKEYFGQFRRPGKTQKTQSKVKMEDQFQAKVKSGQNLARSIIDYYSYLDNDILNQQYKKPLEENDRLELNLSNPYFFQPKLHTILNREKELMQENQYKAKLAEANKNRSNIIEKSLYSGGNFNKHSANGIQGQMGGIGQNQEENVTIEAKIISQIKNISKQPIKHSQIATKYEFVKFTLEQDVFNNFHRHFFPFHDHLTTNVSPRVQIHHHKNRKIKPNGLVINAQMKESNQKFVRKDDISCTKGEFIIVQYVEETPILLSNVGMCERMFIQVNYLEILSKMREEVFNQKSFEEMEDERDRRSSQMPLSYIRHAELWRKIIKDTFGENGKQFYWQPKNTNGKVIGTPYGPGVTVMEGNLGTVPIVRKKPNPRDYLLVRDGKKWVLRKIQNIYTAGQIEPSIKVFPPGSRHHTDFKLAYEKAYIVKHVKQYQTVNFDQLKLFFKGETENSLRKALRQVNATSRDSKNFKIVHEVPVVGEQQLTPQDICLYQRMQKSLCQLKEVGICDIRSNEKMKNVLKEFNKKHYESSEKIAIARVIRQQLQLTSWYLTDSFLKFKAGSSKIQIKGFADPTNGRGGFSFINKPQKQRTAREDMEERAQKQKTLNISDLRKLNCQSSREMLRQMGHNENEIERKTRWDLIGILKGKEGTEFSRKQRETKTKKTQNEKKEITRNFNRLLAWLRDETEEPAFDYSRIKHNKLADYIVKEKDYIDKIRRRYGPKQLGAVKEGNVSDESDDQN